VIPWLDDGTGSDDEDDDSDEEVVDESDLFSDATTIIDSGVTSGADPSAWDPIDIENEQ
jgi:hypothetical protein